MTRRAVAALTGIKLVEQKPAAKPTVATFVERTRIGEEFEMYVPQPTGA
jgi:hypothetical protein